MRYQVLYVDSGEENQSFEDVSLLVFLVPVFAVGTLVLYVIRTALDEPIGSWARYFLIPLLLTFLTLVLRLEMKPKSGSKAAQRAAQRAAFEVVFIPFESF